MCLWRPAKDAKAPDQVAMTKLIEDMTTSGELVQTGGWMPDGPALVVHSQAGKIAVTDGPYTETKEMIGGYAIIEARSREHAIELTKRFIAIAGDGTSEVRQLGY
ncbi:MAG TPA: YciI family protein [Kofleriaceae bacterium]|jgi:hypothetical protein